MLFFDVGNVFVSDDPPGCYIYERVYEYAARSNPLSIPQFFEKREEHIRSGGDIWTFVAGLIPPHAFKELQNEVRGEIYERWEEMSPAIPGMADAARALAARYRLGLLANQPCEIEQVLRNRGLWDLFEVHGVSASVGLSKPDPRFFKWALAQASLSPEEALMVGDRIDNDVCPARALGMKTAWLTLDCDHRGWQPTSEFERYYMDSVCKANVCERRPTSEAETPDIVAKTPLELQELLMQ